MPYWMLDTLLTAPQSLIFAAAALFALRPQRPVLTGLCISVPQPVLYLLLRHLLPLPYWALFAVIFCLGLTGVATVAPTSNLIGSLFGARRLATLFGFTYLLHQIGAFCSAWSGGLCLRYTGDYVGIWYADIVLCLLAGAACLTIRPNRQA